MAQNPINTAETAIQVGRPGGKPRLYEAIATFGTLVGGQVVWLTGAGVEPLIGHFVKPYKADSDSSVTVHDVATDPPAPADLTPVEDKPDEPNGLAAELARGDQPSTSGATATTAHVQSGPGQPTAVGTPPR